jgi:flagellar biosynthesis protein FlhG
VTTVSDQASRLRALVRRLDPRAAAVAAAAPTAAAKPRDRAAPVIAIASGKGGVGKTTTSVNLSIALSMLGKRVTLLDADIGMANADVLCGLMPHMRLDKAVTGSDDESPSLDQIALEAPGGFRLVPGSVGLGRVDELGDAELARLVGRLVELERSSDLVLIDTSAGLGEGVRRFVFAADMTLIVATPEPTSIADAYALVKVLVGMRAQENAQDLRMALIVNQVRNEREALDVHDRIGGVAAKFLGYPLPMLGYIRKDERVGNAVRRRIPVLVATPRASASRDCLRLAESLIKVVEA